ncbi:O-antigen ligase family protein [Acholeplasma sp. OttesenSCG-928-E16]|nr:O-antigen ligase family protein [Acholeplasma sp. OttesenSCG-928-E16]
MLLKIEKFLNTKWYVIGIIVLTFIFWILQDKSSTSIAISKEPMFFVSLLFITVAFTLVAVFFKNTYYLVPIILSAMCIIGVSQRAFSVDFFKEAAYLYVLAFILFSALIFHIIRYKVKLKVGALTIGLMLIAIGYILPFRINEETEPNMVINIVYTIAGPLYLLLYTFLISTSKEKNPEKYIFVFFMLSILISAQFIVQYINCIKEIIDLKQADNIFDAINYGISKKWSNYGIGFELGYDNINAGSMYLAFFLPTIVYYICKKKISWPYVIYFWLVIALVMISASRGGYIGITVSAILCIVLIFMFGNNQSKILLVICAVLLITVTLIPFNENKESIFGAIVERVLNSADDLEGFSNGRFELYREAISEFIKSPIVGGGHIHFTDITQENRPVFYHSTFFHSIGTMGLFGLGSLVFHIVQLVKLIKRKWSFEIMIFGVGMLATHIHGLIDNTFYAFYYMIMTIIMYSAIENTDLSLTTPFKKKVKNVSEEKVVENLE